MGTTRRAVSVTPLRTSKVELNGVFHDCTKLGFEAMYEARPARPFRFMYLSADGIPRDPTKKAVIMADYHMIRVMDSNPRAP